MKKERLGIRGAKPREASLRKLKRAIGSNELWSDGTNSSVLLQDLRKAVHGSIVDDSIWVQEENKRSISAAPAVVAGGRKAAIQLQIHDFDRKFSHYLKGCVLRPVIHDDDAHVSLVDERLDARPNVL